MLSQVNIFEVAGQQTHIGAMPLADVFEIKSLYIEAIFFKVRMKNKNYLNTCFAKVCFHSLRRKLFTDIFSVMVAITTPKLQCSLN